MFTTSTPSYNHPSSMLAHDGRSTGKSELSPLALYSRSLHDYTLRLWTESRRVAEEKARQKATRRKQVVEEENRKRATAAAVIASMQSRRDGEKIAV